MENIIKQLEQLSDDLDIRDITVTLTCSKRALSEKNVVIGQWKDKNYAFDVFINWRSGSLYTSYVTKDELIDLFKEKTIAQISSDDFQDLELVESSDGSTDFSDIDWNPELTDEEKDEAPSASDLYWEGEITDCEYEIEKGGIASIKIEALDMCIEVVK